MPTDPLAIDSAIKQEFRELIELLNEFVANVPQPTLRLVSAIDLLARTMQVLAVGHLRDPRDKYQMIIDRIRLLHARRADGLREILFTDQIDAKSQKLAAMCEEKLRLTL